MNKKIVFFIMLCLILTSVFAIAVFVPKENCAKKDYEYASLLPTLVNEKAKLVAYDFVSDEYVAQNNKGYFKASNFVGCVVIR